MVTISVLFIREHVGSEHEAVLNLNGFDSDLNWLFKSDGSLHSDGGVWSVSGRVHTWSSVVEGYLECQVDRASKGINFFDSDETLKEDIQECEERKCIDSHQSAEASVVQYT